MEGPRLYFFLLPDFEASFFQFAVKVVVLILAILPGISTTSSTTELCGNLFKENSKINKRKWYLKKETYVIPDRISAACSQIFRVVSEGFVKFQHSKSVSL